MDYAAASFCILSVNQMTRTEFLKKVSARIGQPVRGHVLVYAHRIGEVSEPERFPGAWRSYNAKHLDEFVSYLNSKLERGNQPRV